MRRITPTRVIKSWGSEDILVNDEENGYCGKILTVDNTHQSSIHYHRKKIETFKVLEGKLLLELWDRYGKGLIEILTLTPTDNPITLEPYEAHRFLTDTKAKFIEFSTPDYKDDTVRIKLSSKK